ncbi:MAG: hypothetical protein ACI8S6_000654 [Myxococcota bacterium]|jgi:hypothetical protein
MWTLLLLLLSPARADVAPPPPPPVPIQRPTQGYAEPIPAPMREAMIGVTWREGCPVGLDELSLLHIPHLGMDGATHEGLLIVAADQAQSVLQAFAAMHEAGFPIRQMRPTHEFNGSDDASMAADNTSAFNCRPVSGGTRFSQHSYGRAIDINTIENPYIRGSRILPPEGADFTDRSDVRPGMITTGDPVVSAFAAIGWKWGGNWQTTKDYQHFSANGM